VKRVWVSVAVLLMLGTGAAAADPLDADEIAIKQEAVDRHLLRVQQERFEAEARGEDTRRLKRLDREFRRTQKRRGELARDAARAAAAGD
jgi:hypothetical protein